MINYTHRFIHSDRSSVKMLIFQRKNGLIAVTDPINKVTNDK